MSIEIIAEIAQGYEGNEKLSNLLVEGAINSGADSIKLQLIYADEICTKEYEYYSFFKTLEMDITVWKALVKKVHKAKKKIYFDIYGDQSLKVANALDADGVKISTTDFYNNSLIINSLKNFKKVFLSTGGVDFLHLDKLLLKLKSHKNLVLLYGFQDEPTLINDNNLSRLSNLQEKYRDFDWGFMDHTEGDKEEALYIPILSIGMGVKYIEKHITLSNNLPIEDNVSALSIDRFKKFVEIVKSAYRALGSEKLTLTHKESEYKKRAGKIIVSKERIKENTILSNKNITLKRFSTTYNENHCYIPEKIFGKTLNVCLEKDLPITKDIIS